MQAAELARVRVSLSRLGPKSGDFGYRATLRAVDQEPAMSEFGLTRRAFSGLIAATTGSAVAGAAGVTMAQNATAPDSVQPGDAPEAAPAAPVSEPDELLLAALLKQYPGEHLTDEMLAGIRAGLRNNLAESERLRSFPLDNSDAPSIVFRAYRKD